MLFNYNKQCGGPKGPPVPLGAVELNRGNGSAAVRGSGVVGDVLGRMEFYRLLGGGIVGFDWCGLCSPL